MGERQDDRKVIERQTEKLIQSGARPDKAHEAARQSMIRVDRKLREDGKR